MDRSLLPLAGFSAIIMLTCGTAVGDMGSSTLRYQVGVYTDTQDTYIEEDAPTTNYNGLFYAHVLMKGHDPEFSAPVRFGLPSWVYDSSVTIRAAKLGLWVYQTVNLDISADEAYIAPYRVAEARNWSESQATWNLYRTGASWSMEGCEHVYYDRWGNPPESSIRFIEGSPVSQYYEWTVTNSVNYWKSGHTNNGWLMRVQSHDGGAEDEGISFYTREASSLGNRPYLALTWTQTPVADADGSYVCDYLANTDLDGSGSYERDAGGLVTWAWELDGDKDYDDLYGVAPNVTWDYLVNGLGLEPGQSHTIGLKVKDDDNEWSTPSLSSIYIAVPEPVTLALLSLGGLALVRRGRMA